MGRKQKLEGSKIHTVANTYDVVLRVDPDTGMIHSGLGGKHAEGCTREEVFAGLQQIADERDDILYVRCLVLDPADDPLVARTYRIGTYDYCLEEDDPVSGPNLQWSLVVPTYELGRITVGRLPRRWIIRPVTKAAHRELEQAIKRLHIARQRLTTVEQNFEALTEQNPSSMAVLRKADEEAEAED